MADLSIPDLLNSLLYEGDDDDDDDDDVQVVADRKSASSSMVEKVLTLTSFFSRSSRPRIQRHRYAAPTATGDRSSVYFFI